MSDGINAMANKVEPPFLSNILETHVDSSYMGQDFAGSLAGSAQVQNIDGAPQMLDASNGYGQVLDSTNNLGVGGTINLISSQTGN